MIFALSGILYLLSNKMWQLIAVSALMGIGSGLIVPLSTGLISRFFIGKYRTKQFGLSSAITNVTLVLATILTGYLAEVIGITVCRYSITLDFHRTFRILEKEYGE